MYLRYCSGDKYYYVDSDVFSYVVYTEMLPIGFIGTNQNGINFSFFKVPFETILNIPSGIKITR